MKWHNNDHSKIYLWITRRLPKKWLYWCLIQSWAYAMSTFPTKTPSEITWDEVCKLLENK